MSYVSHWQLRLICDFCPKDKDLREDAFYADSRALTFRAAHRAGWKTYPAQVKAKCPECVKAAP